MICTPHQILSIQFIIPRRIGWAGHVARMGNKRGAYWVLMVRPEQRDYLEDLDIDGRIILICILKK